MTGFYMTPLAVSEGSVETLITTIADEPYSSVMTRHQVIYEHDAYWVFYVTNYSAIMKKRIFFRTSSDGVSWSDVQTVHLNASTPIHTDGYHWGVGSNGSHVAFIWHSETNETIYKLGQIHSNLTITFSTTEKIVMTGEMPYLFPQVFFDSSNYVGFSYVYGGSAYVALNDDQSGGWSNASGFPLQFSTMSVTWSMAFFPRPKALRGA